MTIAVWVLAILLASQFAWAVKLAYERNRYQASATALAREVVRLLNVTSPPQPLTPPPIKAQDEPKRFTGSQLRRMAEQVNVAQWDSLQERPNSEILKEQEHD
jgi:hypothetical protein